MTQRPVPSTETLLADTSKLIDVMNTSSDLAVAIVAVSYLDACLGNLLRSSLADRDEADKLLDIGNPLESFGARYRLARAMNLIDETRYEDLKKIGKIRNLFAHHHAGLDFGNQEIGRLCDNLSLNQNPIDVVTGRPIKVPHFSEATRVRGRFLMYATYLSQQFLTQSAAL